MIKKSVKNVRLFEIFDAKAQKVFSGCNQKWFSTRWKRLSGCGPCVVSNIINYLNRSRSGEKVDDSPIQKSEIQALMEDVWEYVTPTMRGIPSTELLGTGISSYIQAKDAGIELVFADIPEDKTKRPAFPDLLTFLSQALEADTPLAFLVLNSGEEKRLDDWHWVTVIAIEFEEDGSVALVDIVDEGEIYRANLHNWFFTTTLGGGFVGFNIKT